MPLHPGSAPADEGSPDDYAHTHPSDRAQTWGWHGEWGRWSEVAGWISVAALLLLTTATHYHASWTVTLICAAAILAGWLIRARIMQRSPAAHRRRNRG